MNRTEQALAAMRAEPERGWNGTQMSLVLRCGPTQARGAMLRLVGTGCAVIGDDGLFRLPDAPPPAPDPVETVYGLLTASQELTPLALAERLGLSEDEVIGHVAALARARRIDLWASLPTTQQDWERSVAHV